jgi:hypothetical protein
VTDDPREERHMEAWSFRALNLLIEKGGLAKKAQYKIHLRDQTIAGDDIWPYLDSLGQKGWELVSVVPMIGSETRVGLLDVNPREATRTTGYMLWFKRRTESSVDPLP